MCHSVAGSGDIDGQSPRFDQKQAKLVVNDEITVNHGNIVVVLTRKRLLIVGNGGFNGGKASHGLA